MGVFDTILDPSTNLASIDEKLIDKADSFKPEDFTKNTNQRTKVQNQLVSSYGQPDIPEDVAMTRPIYSRPVIPTRVDNERAYRQVTEGMPYIVRKAVQDDTTNNNGKLSPGTQALIEQYWNPYAADEKSWWDESAPKADVLADTDKEGRVKLNDSDLDEYANNAVMDPTTGLWNMAPTPGNGAEQLNNHIAEGIHSFYRTIGQMPTILANNIWGEPEYAYELPSGNKATVEDMNNLENLMENSSYLLSGDEDDNLQVSENPNDVYLQLPSGNWIQTYDSEGNFLPKVNYGDSNDDITISFDDSDDVLPVEDFMNLEGNQRYGRPVNDWEDQQVPEELLPNSNITWSELLNLYGNQDYEPIQQNPGLLGLNKERLSKSDDENESNLDKIKAALPEGLLEGDLSGIPKWFLDVGASSAPYMLGSLGIVNGVISGLADSYLAGLGVDPNSYDPETRTYKEPESETNLQRGLRMTGAFLDPTIDALIGAGGARYSQRKLMNNFEKALYGDKKARKKLDKLQKKEDYPLKPMLWETAEEGLEEVPGQYLQHLGEIGPENWGLNKNEDGTFDESTPWYERVGNEVFGNMAPDFLGGALFGGAMNARKLPAAIMKTKESLKTKDEKFKDYQKGNEDRNLSPAMFNKIDDLEKEEE